MLHRFLIFVIVSISFAATVPINAQSRRIITLHSIQYGTQSIDIEAYLNEAVDEQPHFPGGDGAMLKFINRERNYPPEAYHAGIQGRVLCSFIVGTDGTISNIEVLRGVEDSLNKEAVRIISRMPKWVAGKIGDTNVPVYCILPIAFRL